MNTAYSRLTGFGDDAMNSGELHLTSPIASRMPKYKQLLGNLSGLEISFNLHEDNDHETEKMALAWNRVKRSAPFGGIRLDVFQSCARPPGPGGGLHPDRPNRNAP